MKDIEYLSKEEWLDRVNFPNKARKTIIVEPIRPVKEKAESKSKGEKQVNETDGI